MVTVQPQLQGVLLKTKRMRWKKCVQSGVTRTCHNMSKRRQCVDRDRGVHAKNMEKSTVRLKMTRPGQHWTTHLGARNSYDNENRVHSSRVMGLPEVAENAPRVASEKQHGTESKFFQSLILSNATFGKLYLQKQAIQEHQNWDSKCEESVLSAEVPTHFW